MRKTLATMAVTMTLAAVLAGCGGAEPEDDRESEGQSYVDDSACENSMRVLRSYASFDEPTYERYFADTLTECETAAEWLEAARTFPRAVGYQSADLVTELPLEAACRMPANVDRPTCVDGVASGVLDGRP